MSDWYSGDITSPEVKLSRGYNPVDPVNLDWTCPVNATATDIDEILYSKLTLTLAPGYLTGKIRRTLVRMPWEDEGEDATAYADITITRPDCPVLIFPKSGPIINPALTQPSEAFDWLIWADWSGSLDRGRTYQWRLNIGAGITATLKTRYVKVWYRAPGPKPSKSAPGAASPSTAGVR